jgi:hypothetical protein
VQTRVCDLEHRKILVLVANLRYLVLSDIRGTSLKAYPRHDVETNHRQDSLV